MRALPVILFGRCACIWPTVAQSCKPRPSPQPQVWSNLSQDISKHTLYSAILTFLLFFEHFQCFEPFPLFWHPPPYSEPFTSLNPSLHQTLLCSEPSTAPNPPLLRTLFCFEPSSAPNPTLIQTLLYSEPSSAPNPPLLRTLHCSDPSSVPNPILYWLKLGVDYSACCSFLTQICKIDFSEKSILSIALAHCISTAFIHVAIKTKRSLEWTGWVTNKRINECSSWVIKIYFSGLFIQNLFNLTLGRQRRIWF